MDAPCVIEELLLLPFKCREFKEKMQLIQSGRPCPAMPSLMAACEDYLGERGFHVDRYEKVPWLTGSAKIGALFCWPCLLFASEKNTWNTVGTIDLNTYQKMVEDHEKSESHIRSFLEMQTFGSMEIDSRLTAVAAHNSTAQRNRDVLIRFIDCMFYIIKCKLPFDPVRYFDSDACDNEGYVLGKGNYLSTLDFLSEFDPLLKSHMSKSSVFSEKTTAIKNGLIGAMATVVRNQIKKELEDVQFASILFDEIQTVDSRLLCTVVRYATRDGEIKERFISAENKSCNCSKEAIFDHLSAVVDDLQIKDKLVSHSYDGRAVYVSEITELCNKVRVKCPHALFVHNFNLNLQSVLESSLLHIKECRLCILCLTQVPEFFQMSKPQVTALQAFLEREYPDVLPTACNFTDQPLRTTFRLRKELLEFFDSVTEDCTDFNTRFKAEGCVSSLESFEGCFYLSFLSEVFGEIDELLRALKMEAFVAPMCNKNVDGMCDKVLCNADKTFNSAWDYATNEAEEEAVPSKPKRRNGSEVSPRTSYRIQLNKCVQNVTAQINRRFSSFSLVKFLALLNPKLFKEYQDAFPFKLFQNLIHCYPKSFNFERLKNELSVLYSFDMGVFTHPRKLLKCICDRGLDKVIPEAYHLACLCLTIPSCTATEGETWPSTLRHYESWIKSVEEEESSTDLAFISIEVSLLLSLKEKPGFYTDVIDEFAKKEAMPEFVFHTLATWPADPLQIMTSCEDTSQYTPSSHIIEASPCSPILQETMAVYSTAERARTSEAGPPQLPISLMDIKEEYKFSAPAADAFTIWTTGISGSVSDPSGTDGPALKMETEEAPPEAMEFAFVEVGGIPPPWLNDVKGD